MRQAHNGAGDKKNISKDAEEQSENQASREDQQLHQRRFRFLSEKDKAAFEKFRKRACQCQQVFQQTGMPRRIAGQSSLADHLRRLRSQRRKIRPRTNPIPSAVNTALVGFSRTYCSASSWNVRTRSLASPQACSALPRASPHACSAFPRYSPAIAPAADLKSSAALRACCLLLSNLSCASAAADASGSLLSSAIGNLQLIFALSIRVLCRLGK